MLAYPHQQLHITELVDAKLCEVKPPKITLLEGHDGETTVLIPYPTKITSHATPPAIAVTATAADPASLARPARGSWASLM